MAELEDKKEKRWGFIFLFWPGVFASGIFVAFLTAWLNKVHFGLYTWPLVACVDVFTFTTVGFFTTEGKSEVLYGSCSIASAFCAIVQMALLF